MLKLSDNPPIIPPCFDSLTQIPGRWWVAHTKSRVEKRLGWDLLRRGIGYFLPLFERTFISGGRKRLVLCPLFSSYVFFCGTEEDRCVALRTNRVARTLEVADQGELISELAAIEMALRHATIEPYPRPPVGERCLIITGAFKGTEGIVLRHRGRRRIVLQVRAIGQGAVMELDGDFLEFLPTPVETGLVGADAKLSPGRAHLSVGAGVPERLAKV